MYGCGFLIVERDLSKLKIAKRPLYCCCWWTSSRLGCMPGVGPGESFAPVALAWVARLLRVAVVCGPQLAGLQRT